MPVYEYECGKGHVTTRIVPLRREPSKTIRCNAPIGNGRCTTNGLKCKRRARKRTTYRVSVGGDLPTRGAF